MKFAASDTIAISFILFFTLFTTSFIVSFLVFGSIFFSFFPFSFKSSFCSILSLCFTILSSFSLFKHNFLEKRTIPIVPP